MAQTIKVLVDAGHANAGPPIGPALGPIGVNTMNVVNKINELTKDLEGITVPVSIIIDNNKNFTIEVGSPMTSALIKKELNAKKGTGKAGTETIGNISFDQVKKIARAKYSQLISKSEKSAILEVLGTCRTMGVTVDKLSIQDVTSKVKNGEYKL
jgi:large subunit ribosomal protein L11